MIAALLSFLPARAWLYGALAAALIALIGWHMLHEAGQRRAAVEQAVAVVDARWQAELTRANAVAETRLKTDQARIADLSTRLGDALRQIETPLAHIEDENAKLPKGPSCGLDRDRVRLLDRL